MAPHTSTPSSHTTTPGSKRPLTPSSPYASLPRSAHTHIAAPNPHHVHTPAPARAPPGRRAAAARAGWSTPRMPRRRGPQAPAAVWTASARPPVECLGCGQRECVMWRRSVGHLHHTCTTKSGGCRRVASMRCSTRLPGHLCSSMSDALFGAQGRAHAHGRPTPRACAICMPARSHTCMTPPPPSSCVPRFHTCMTMPPPPPRFMPAPLPHVCIGSTHAAAPTPA
eukprot:283891-Chlamydomonas_euryale.AAC.1